MQQLPRMQHDAQKSALLQDCTEVATASGGLLGLTNRVSAAERDLLTDLKRQFA
jgi:hypothetical protein